MSETAITDAGEKDPRHEPREGRNIFGRIGLFVRQVVSELRRVITPTAEEWRRYTLIVAVFVIIIVVLVTIMDFVFNKGVQAVFGD